MFILTLRGPFGIKILMIFHLLIFASGVSLYLISRAALETLICTAVFISYVLTIRHMRKHRELLEFNNPKNSVFIFPDCHRSIKLLLFFELFVIFTTLPLTLGLLLLDADLDRVQAISLMVFYYPGNISLVGFINLVISKWECNHENN